MSKEILTTQDLHLYYGDKEALKGINLNFDAKGITALIGPSVVEIYLFADAQSDNDLIQMSRLLGPLI